MKDSHDTETTDMAAFERSFRKYPNIRMHKDPQTASERSRSDAVKAYLHEKPYLREALRRTCK